MIPWTKDVYWLHLYIFFLLVFFQNSTSAFSWNRIFTVHFIVLVTIFELWLPDANMKKFTFKGVLDGFTNKTSDGPSTPKPSKNEVEETLKSSQLRGCKVCSPSHINIFCCSRKSSKAKSSLFYLWPWRLSRLYAMDFPTSRRRWLTTLCKNFWPLGTNVGTSECKFMKNILFNFLKFHSGSFLFLALASQASTSTWKVPAKSPSFNSPSWSTTAVLLPPWPTTHSPSGTLDKRRPKLPILLLFNANG